MEQRNAIDEVNQEISKNQADIEEISEGLALQEDKTASMAEELFEMDQDMAAYENQTSSLAEDVMAQGNVIFGVNRGISENQAQIGGIWEGMALQEK